MSGGKSVEKAKRGRSQFTELLVDERRKKWAADQRNIKINTEDSC